MHKQPIISLLWGRTLDCWSLKVSTVVDVDGGDGSSVLVDSLVGEGFFLRKRALKTACLLSGVA